MIDFNDNNDRADFILRIKEGNTSFSLLLTFRGLSFALEWVFIAMQS